MNKESLQKVLLLEIKKLVQELEKAIETLPFDEVTYLEGKFNECLEIYQRVFFFEVPNDVWASVIRVWHLVTTREEKERSSDKK